MSEPTNNDTRRLEIKKYSNRRYYDATHSRHLTLDEIRNLIQQGYDIQVTDAKTSADITAQVLTQLILELDTPKLDSLPVPLLVRLIRMNDQLVKDFIEKYFNQALKSFLDYQQNVEEQIRRTHGLPSAFPSMSAWTKAMLEPFASAFSGRASESGPPQAGSEREATAGEDKDLAAQVRALRREMAELKRKKGGKRPKAARRGR